MYSDEYIRVTEAIADSKDWALHTLLKDLKPIDQIKKIKEVFLAACKKRDDKFALQYFKWLLNAVDDAKLIPFLEKERNDEVLPYTEEVKKAKTDARINRAKIARELYNKLPSSSKGTAQQFIAQDETIPVDVDIPTLLKTKRAILTEIAEWWGETEDEKEADEIFDFLNDIPTQFDEEVKIKLDVIRKATRSEFPVPRLTRQLLLLQPEEFPREGDIAPILAIARARNRRLNIAALEMSIVQHMEECTKASFQLLENIAKKISIFDAETRELIEMIESSHDIYGKTQVSYSDVNTIKVLIEQKCRFNWCRDRDDDKEFYEQFEKARDKVVEWKKKYSNRKVELVLNTRGEYDRESDKPRFSRKQNL